MESQPQNPEFRNNPEKFNPCKKHEYMVPISRQFPFGADKAVQISRAVSFDKGTQAKLCHTKKERSGSVVECLTQDRRAVGSSLTGVTALWSLSKTHLS